MLQILLLDIKPIVTNNYVAFPFVGTMAMMAAAVSLLLKQVILPPQWRTSVLVS
jgi:hypothetical protein